MENQAAKRFSQELKGNQFIDVQIDQVKHPLIKQIITQVLSEDSSDSSLGSAFGEGQPAG